MSSGIALSSPGLQLFMVTLVFHLYMVSISVYTDTYTSNGISIGVDIWAVSVIGIFIDMVLESVQFQYRYQDLYKY